MGAARYWSKFFSFGRAMPPKGAVLTANVFLMNVLAEEANVPPITIVQNWTAGLKK
jgi:hypothetical protein